jgi:hypothetical protein
MTKQQKEQEAVIAMQRLLSFGEAQKEEKIREQRIKDLKNPSLLQRISLQVLCAQLCGISGQRRSTILERWWQENKGFTKNNPRDEIGDFEKDGEHLEYKSCFLSNKEFVKWAARGGQVRLSQNVQSYLLTTMNTGTGELRILKIPHTDLLNHYLERRISVDFSHKSNNANGLKKQDKDGTKEARAKLIQWVIEKHEEIGICLKYSEFDWNVYQITEDQL